MIGARKRMGPCALRFPRGEGRGVPMPQTPVAVPVGKGRICQQGTDIAFLSLGTIIEETTKAAKQLEQDGLSVTLADARFAKPFDQEMIKSLVQNHQGLVIVEEGSGGGFASHVMTFLANEGLLSSGCDVRIAQIKDAYIDHDSRPGQLAKAGIDAAALVALAREMPLLQAQIARQAP